MEEELFSLTDGDPKEEEYYMNMKISKIRIIQIIKAKKSFLDWYSSAIQTNNNDSDNPEALNKKK